MAGIREKQKRVTEQGYAAAKKDHGIYPRELQNVPGDRWEDAKVYNKNTRQGQNYWQDHMKNYPKYYGEWITGTGGREEREQIIENKKRLGFPTKGPMAKPIELPTATRRRKIQNAIADRLLKKGNIKKREEKW